MDTMLEYGFTAINGTEWSDSDVDVYNTLTEKIKSTPSERMRDERNRFFRIASGMIRA